MKNETVNLQDKVRRLNQTAQTQLLEDIVVRLRISDRLTYLEFAVMLALAETNQFKITNIILDNQKMKGIKTV